jgi:hypothetical protein
MMTRWAVSAFGWQIRRESDDIAGAYARCLAVGLSAPIASEGADRKEGSSPWIATAVIIRDGGDNWLWGYLKSGLIITAAHLTDVEANMGASA